MVACVGRRPSSAFGARPATRSPSASQTARSNRRSPAALPLYNARRRLVPTYLQDNAVARVGRTRARTQAGPQRHATRAKSTTMVGRRPAWPPAPRRRNGPCPTCPEQVSNLSARKGRATSVPQRERKTAQQQARQRKQTGVYLHVYKNVQASEVPRSASQAEKKTFDQRARPTDEFREWQVLVVSAVALGAL